MRVWLRIPPFARQRALVIIPSLDLIAVWNDSVIEDHDQSPGNPATRTARARGGGSKRLT